MAIDADGAPNAYSPEDTGRDELANAGAPPHWNGIITDRVGSPLIQLKRDPFPGTTSPARRFMTKPRSSLTQLCFRYPGNVRLLGHHQGKFI
jgi:hypothetical protein